MQLIDKVRSLTKLKGETFFIMNIVSIISILIDYILHIDRHLGSIISSYGILVYLLLFLVIFCETGLVVLPFLPGDSLIFATGAFCATGSLNLTLSFVLLVVAAIVGDAVNYTIGHSIGEGLMQKENIRFIKREHIDRTVAFFDKHGGKTIALARFAPIIRTFAPFVAGAGKMKYQRFLRYNAIGGLVWVTLFLFAGYFFGNLQFVKNNFSIIIIAIIFISLLPALLMNFTNKKQNDKNTTLEEI